MINNPQEGSDFKALKADLNTPLEKQAPDTQCCPKCATTLPTVSSETVKLAEQKEQKCWRCGWRFEF